MRFTSIQSRLILLLLAFCLLVLVAAGATFWGIQSQRRDAALINLANRQRVEIRSSALLGQTAEIARLSEVEALLKESQLKWIQWILLGSALLLVAAGAWFVRNHLILRVNHLRPVTERIPEQSQAWTDELEQRVAQRTQELEALYTVSREITSRLSIDEVLSSITQKTRELLGSDVAFLCLYNEEEQSLALLSSNGPEGAVARRKSTLNSVTTRSVLAGDRALRCDQGCRGYCEMVAPQFRSCHIAAPLKIEAQIIGALCAGSIQPEAFGEDDLDVLTKLANVAAVALQNARLYEQAELLAASEERQRIAAEMHDGLAQTLSYLKLVVNQAAAQVEGGQVDTAMYTLERVNSALDQAIADTRRAIASLQEQGPLTVTLQEQLALLAAEFSHEKPAVEWDCPVQFPVLLTRQDSEQVLRVTREALVNAKRHSNASQIGVNLQKMECEFQLTVADNGQGFNPETAQDKNGGYHFGLKIMRARAARLAGQVDIQSGPGQGTRVCLTWPVGREIT